MPIPVEHRPVQPAALRGVARLARVLAGTAVFFLSACAGPSARLPQPATLFDDSRFAGHAIDSAATADNLFALSPAMRAHLDSPPFRAQLRKLGKQRGLVAALYDSGELKLEYDGALTRTAAEAYAARRGNCLSLVIMTAAFARALDLRVQYQNVVIDESWRRAGQLVVASGHVNLALAPPLMREPGTITEPAAELTIDFLPGEAVAGYHSYPLAESTIVAMYLNNRAVESMLQGQLDQAYWWARAALERDGGFGPAYNTLAVIYQRHGDGALAERSWRLALAREPENVVALRNLAPLLGASGRGEEAAALLQRAAAIEPHPPFYFYQRGMEAMARHDWTAAKSLFEREVARAPYHDEFHFWLGIALLRLGQAGAAKTQMALALQTAASAESSRLYGAKLELLRGQSATRLQ